MAKKKGKGKKKNKGPLKNLPKWMKRDPIKTARKEYRVQRKTANRDLGRHLGHVSDTYGALGTALQPLAGRYDSAAQQIASDLQSQLGAFSGLIGGFTGPAGEQAAGANLYGTLGAGGLSLLASDRARNLGYQTSVQRQAAIEPAVLSRKLLGEHKDYMKGLREQIPIRAEELRDLRFSQLMAIKEFLLRKKQTKNQKQSDAALQKFLEAQISGRL